MNSPSIYNPLSLPNLGRSIVQELLAQPVIALSDLMSFGGPGLYAIYYIGSFDVYGPLVEQNKDERFAMPIYVGKANSAGGRKGGFRTDMRKAPLFKRLDDHAKSIRVTTNLEIADFYCRYLVVEDIWVTLGEAVLIEQTRPLWNVIVDGFGNHDPGVKRGGQRPQWDTLHPGRHWAESKEPNVKSLDLIRSNVRQALAGGPAEELSDEVQAEEAESDEG